VRVFERCGAGLERVEQHLPRHLGYANCVIAVADARSEERPLQRPRSGDPAGHISAERSSPPLHHGRLGVIVRLLLDPRPELPDRLMNRRGTSPARRRSDEPCANHATDQPAIVVRLLPTVCNELLPTAV
jgi:hypothetical protein